VEVSSVFAPESETPVLYADALDAAETFRRQAEVRRIEAVTDKPRVWPLENFDATLLRSIRSHNDNAQPLIQGLHFN